MAITAWSANVVTNSICFSVNGLTSWRVRAKTPITVPARKSGTPRTVLYPAASRRLVAPYSASASTSKTWTTRAPPRCRGLPGEHVRWRTASGVTPLVAHSRKKSPSRR